MPVSKEYIVKRIILLIFVILGVLFITFVITRLIPARPELLWAGPHATIEQIERARKQLHLDKPIYIQFILYLQDFLTGNWGISWRTKSPVIVDVLSTLTATLELVIIAFFFAFIIGIPVGVLAALKKYSWIDDLTRIITVVGASIPVFWLALIVQLVFGSWLGILPSAKRVDEWIVIVTGFKPVTGFYLLDSVIQGNLPVFIDTVKRIILPALVLAAYPFCLSTRMTRAVMIEVLSEQHVKSLIAWGLSKKTILFKYSLKNTIVPVIASLGLSFGYTIIGAFMVELVFVWPGIGFYAAMSLLSFDYPAVIGCVITVAIFYSIINTLVDMIHSIIDPRVRL
ncbi:MAG: ABC transporter permease [Aigarchaeota archaeon]|nr:ABC transporter permease [Aigarchaeota archaeon]MCX8193064.1 ABC transporter permease [Nitrososphaeria archaeon]MDW7986913.1 ABC transporter permease [Nitrososphaerota archaeon]